MTIAAPRQKIEPGPYRVMVVDDSAVIRGIVTRWLESDPQMVVVASCANGEQAVRVAADKGCEVIVLDIEMPVMDGITALPKLVQAVPGVQIVMSSTLTRRNADISLRALSMGAADYVTKPETLRGGASVEEFRSALSQKVKVLAAARRSRAREPHPSAKAAMPGPVAESGSGAQLLTLRPMPPRLNPAILAIGSSTGGPQALLEVMRVLGPVMGHVPVVITQHMPPTFTAILAEHVGTAAGCACAEGKTGDVVKPGHIYIAPGGHHMELATARNGQVVIQLNTKPPENFCRPSVDPMFRSVAQIYGARALAVVLTGMGSDGREGARRIVGENGVVIAQDEATSVVWGMPGAVATAGLCSAVLPLGKIGPQIKTMLAGGGRAS